MQKHLSLILISIICVSCSFSPTQRNPAATREQNVSGILKLPALKQTKLTDEQMKNLKMDASLRSALESYLSFLGLDANSKAGQDTFDRLMISSTQFLFCADQSNWQCLETTPKLQPSKKFRVETYPGFGKKIIVNRPLKIKSYYTSQWNLRPEEKKMQSMLSEKLSELFLSQKWDSISMALYGIDDTHDSMKNVAEAIINSQKNGAQVRAVFDAEEKVQNVIQFQYEDTPQMMKKLNEGKSSTAAKIEEPISRDIMHNKFFVFHKGDDATVWTGTTNVSKTCMGMEENANMAIVIEDAAVAQAYQTEFEEMSGNQKMSGLFHKNKRPNTSRYFQFSDGHELRVHFSPTDDGEHRTIIPMLLSAQKDDEIRIAMFGTGGIEYVRALQFAAAKGAKIKIVLDNFTGFGVGSWASPKSQPNIQEQNPYDPKSKNEIEFRKSTWSGLNHHKSATLTRALPNGIKRVEMMIVGSQNWSASGNDDNDENMLSIRDLNPKSDGLEIGAQFNAHFDTKLWTNSK